MRLEELDEFDGDLISDRLSTIFSDTEKYLWLSTSLYPDFYNQSEIKESLEKLADKDVEIRVLLDEDVDIEDRRERVNWLFTLPSAKIRHSEKNIPHWVIADGNNLRLEKSHESGRHGGPNLIVSDADKMLSDVFETRFEKFWYNSPPVDE